MEVLFTFMNLLGTTSVSSQDSAGAEQIAKQVNSLGTWITGFSINGTSYGGAYLPEFDARILQFIARFKSLPSPPRSILECGCLEGGHTTMLANAFPSTQIHAVDVREESLTKARLLAKLRDCQNIEFQRDDFDAPQSCFNQSYDVIFCVGLLYHLRWPKEFLARSCKASPVLYLWTVFCAETDVALAEANFRGRLYLEPTDHPLSAIRGESFFPALGSLMDMLWEAGYTNIELLRKEITQNGNGPAILLYATR